MVGSISGNSSGLMTALMKEATAKENVEISVVKKAQQIDQIQGEAALKLIDAAVPAAGVDVHV